MNLSDAERMGARRVSGWHARRTNDAVRRALSDTSGRLSPRCISSAQGRGRPWADVERRWSCSRRKRGSAMSEEPVTSEPSVTAEPSVTCEPPVVRDGVSRRTLLRLGAVGGAGVALVGVEGMGRPFLAKRGLLSADGAFAATSMTLGDQLYIEAFPTSPLILAPFTDELFIPKA